MPVTVLKAPGAEQIQVTKEAADVSDCLPVGNVDGSYYRLRPADAEITVRNQALGLGGDTLLITFDPTDHVFSPSDASLAGIAYRCRKSSTAK